MSFLKGRVLSQWLKTRPDQDSRNQVAQTLNDIFVQGFYGMNMIHADPNPGNFLVMDNLDIGLVDFGCVRAVSPGFVAQYQELIRIGGSKNKEAYHALMVRMKMISPDLNSKILNQVISLFMDVGEWINQLFRHEYFDFKDHPGFMAQGRNMSRHIQKIRRHIQGFPPEFIFLDRTRYGLLRLYEQMGVRIRFRNDHEYNDYV